MSNEICILTNVDFTVLEFLRGRCQGADDPLASILKRKIESALVMAHSDVPGNVATLNSRVTFSVDGRDRDTRIISSARSESPASMYLPVTNLRGLALLGLAEGHGFSFLNKEGIEERVLLEKVLHQPAMPRQEKEAVEAVAKPAQPKPFLRLVGGTLTDQAPKPHTDPGGFDDDPGPSAA
ncbi:nucleoside-diphosphate kinase [Hoeflea sp. YIM 152468]|uniref:nucleoside-diphosphate kinase n=1 Tax=Hoeflea sp. YIM 152468 TaxID=3031759 RepID=UPI0023D9D413|nr:nucleoside-diphosphate kinase [Hoeflea sp. YIM 152468]MDF1609325.1 nucleoside-diphosphate kinase [Hoeflea sp. YIM 152468]